MVMANYVSVVFKKDGEQVAVGQGALGCVLRGEPHDTLSLLRQATLDVQHQISTGSAKPDALDYTSVVVPDQMGVPREFTRTAIAKMEKDAARPALRKGGGIGPRF